MVADLEEVEVSVVAEPGEVAAVEDVSERNDA
jgi:hypothetical protein